MKNSKITLLTLTLSVFSGPLLAQSASSSDFLFPQSPADRDVEYNISAAGVQKPIIWGLDLAWDDEGNLRRGIEFMGNKNVNIIRSSFTPTAPLIDGELPAYELGRLNNRIRMINLLGRPMDLVLNCDHPSVDSWYKYNSERWEQLIAVTRRHHEEAGHKVVTVSPFNEPDYSATGQGSKYDFRAIAKRLKENPDFDDVRISGGNTLNNDKALEWYEFLMEYLDEGNTHQLAGEFDTYAEFFTKVRANGHHASNDELHNVMEAMVGVEYGMQTGIWWGTAEYTRGEFVKASSGERLGYAEHRPNWTAASVYRTTDGRIQAFGGTSERQATTTSYRYISQDRPVYYNGYGPLRDFTLELPGGTGYQEGQTNAETVINVTYGEDVQPVVDGKYMLMNRNSTRVMEIYGGSKDAGANVVQYNQRRNSLAYQCWNVKPVDSRIGNDFAYFSIRSEHNNMSLDLLDWSLENEANIIMWNHAGGGNQQWAIEYAGEGFFYIINRHSGKCIEVAGSSTASNANVRMNEKTGAPNQQWRFIPVDATANLNAPASPVNFTAKGQNASVLLKWDLGTETELAGYNVYRGENPGEEFNTIARGVSGNSFVDNNVDAGVTYYYKIAAVSKALNRSEFSEVISSEVTGAKGMTALLQLDENLNDISENLNHAAFYGTPAFEESVDKSMAVVLDGENNFIQLPHNIANHKEITIAMWVYWGGGSNWQRVFDFGNGESQYMFLTARNNSNRVRFAIKNGGDEVYLDAPMATIMRNVWSHVTVSIGESGIRIYKDGELMAEKTDVSISPADFKPLFNYIGRSQFNADPMFKGRIDDFRVYNYELPAEEIAMLPEQIVNSIEGTQSDASEKLAVWPVPANDVLNISYPLNGLSTVVTITDMNGREVMRKAMEESEETVNVSALNAGMYILHISNKEESVYRKIMIRH